MKENNPEIMQYLQTVGKCNFHAFTQVLPKPNTYLHLQLYENKFYAYDFSRIGFLTRFDRSIRSIRIDRIFSLVRQSKLKKSVAVNFSEKLTVSSKIKLSVNGCQ